MLIDFSINLTPKALKRHRVGKYGRMYDPSAKDKKKIKLLIARFKPKYPLKSDLMVKLVFTMPYPKKYYRTGKFKHMIKDNAPQYCKTKPDIDNLSKMLLDCMNNMFYVDDSQVCMLQAEKIYGRYGKTEVIISEI